MTRTRYPVFRLFWKKKGNKIGTYHTIHKKSFLGRLDGLTQRTDVVSARFRIEYAHNESIEYSYSQFQQMINDVRIFTSASEMRFILGYI